MTIIGWDSDGVLYKFVKSYHIWLNFKYGMNIDPELQATTWNWFTQWQTLEEFEQCLDEGVDAGYIFWEGDLHEPQIAQNIADLAAVGHQNHLITHRFSGKSRCPRAATEYFYAQRNIKFDSITYSKDKTVVKTDVFLEDNLSNYDALEAAGIKSYLINRPYNLKNDNRRRVNSVQEFTDLILEDRW